MTPRPVVVITHLAEADTRWIEAALDRRRLPRQAVRPFLGDPLPDVAECAAVVCIGGPQSAHRLGEFPFLHAEQDFLRRATAAGVPVLGICLGAQLLAAALGGEAMPGEHGLEHGFIDVTAVDGADHPLLPVLAGRWFSFHSDTLVAPLGAVVLAVSDRYVQAWALGSALGVQFHPELSVPGIEGLAGKERNKLALFGVDARALVEGARAREPAAREASERLIGGWLDLSCPAPATSTTPHTTP